MKSKLNYYFTLAIIGLFYSNTQAQNTPYIDPIYSNISTSTVNYSDVYEDAFHKMDIYHLYIQLPSDQKSVEIRIYNLHAQLQFITTLTETTTLKLPLQSGLYKVLMTGKHAQTETLVIE